MMESRSTSCSAMAVEPCYRGGLGKWGPTTRVCLARSGAGGRRVDVGSLCVVSLRWRVSDVGVVQEACVCHDAAGHNLLAPCRARQRAVTAGPVNGADGAQSRKHTHLLSKLLRETGL